MTDTELRMTNHELMVLLSMTPTESAGVTLGLLRLDPQDGGEALHNAGLTTLLVRGLASLQGEKIVPVDKAAVVASVLAQAQEWLEISLTTPSSSHALLAVGSNVGAVLVTISPYGVHDIQPIESGPAMLELGMHLIQAYLTEAAEGLPATAAVRRRLVAGESSEAHLTAAESGKWALQHTPGSSGETYPQAEAMELFRAALAA